jgi:dynein heavy chain
VQGICLAGASSVANEPGVLIRLWLHEALRVFGDRLTDAGDHAWLHDFLQSTVMEKFDVSVEVLCTAPAATKEAQTPASSGFRAEGGHRAAELVFWYPVGASVGEAGAAAAGPSTEVKRIGGIVTRRSSDESRYVEVSSSELMIKVLGDALVDYRNGGVGGFSGAAIAPISVGNAAGSSAGPPRPPLDLVMFTYALLHLSRLSRILRLPGGNALLVGMGGCGRQSLTRLAAHVAGFELRQVALSRTYGMVEWRADLRALLRIAGGEARPVVFLFSDAQFSGSGGSLGESFLEDLNNLLNDGEVPHLFAAPEDHAALVAACSGAFAAARDASAAKSAAAGFGGLPLRRESSSAGAGAGAGSDSSAALLAFFAARVREHLHVVLALSPVGDAFRRRLRQYPSLVNCCTIDWYTEWPAEALLAVAAKSLEGVQLGGGSGGGGEEAAAADDSGDGAVAGSGSEALLGACASFSVVMHRDSVRLSQRFLAETGRPCYVTSGSHLNLMAAFKGLLHSKRAGVSAALARYNAGLDSLAVAETRVADMQTQLTHLKPVLMAAEVETAGMVEAALAETAAAAEIRAKVGEEEAAAAAKAATARDIKRECEAALSESMVLMRAALMALNTLKKSDLVEMRQFSKPPAAVRLVLEALCIIMGVKPLRVVDSDDPSGAHKVNDFWEPAKKHLLADPKLLDNLIAFDKDHVPAETIARLQPYVTMAEFEPKVIRNASVAAAGLAAWLCAIVKYDGVAKIVAPKKQSLRLAEAEYAVVAAGLRERQRALQRAEDAVAALEAQVSAALARRQGPTLTLTRAQAL